MDMIQNRSVLGISEVLVIEAYAYVASENVTDIKVGAQGTERQGGPMGDSVLAGMVPGGESQGPDGQEGGNTLSDPAGIYLAGSGQEGGVEGPQEGAFLIVPMLIDILQGFFGAGQAEVAAGKGLGCISVSGRVVAEQAQAGLLDGGHFPIGAGIILEPVEGRFGAAHMRIGRIGIEESFVIEGGGGAQRGEGLRGCIQFADAEEYLPAEVIQGVGGEITSLPYQHQGVLFQVRIQEKADEIQILPGIFVRVDGREGLGGEEGRRWRQGYMGPASRQAAVAQQVVREQENLGRDGVLGGSDGHPAQEQEKREKELAYHIISACSAAPDGHRRGPGNRTGDYPDLP